jgi:hypothetical protein
MFIHHPHCLQKILAEKIAGCDAWGRPLQSAMRPSHKPVMKNKVPTTKADQPESRDLIQRVST